MPCGLALTTFLSALLSTVILHLISLSLAIFSINLIFTAMSEKSLLLNLKEGNFISLVAPYSVLLLISDSENFVLEISVVPDFEPVKYVILYDPNHAYLNIEHPFLLCELHYTKSFLNDENKTFSSKYTLKPLLFCTSPLFDFKYDFMKSFYNLRQYSDSTI